MTGRLSQVISLQKRDSAHQEMCTNENQWEKADGPNPSRTKWKEKEKVNIAITPLLGVSKSFPIFRMMSLRTIACAE
jgi:hypothetical protein